MVAPDDALAPSGQRHVYGGMPTGQQLTYDAERRLSTWASGPGSTPTNETTNLYDGEGMRVEQVVLGAVCSPTCSEQTQSDTLYLAGGIEEIATASGTTTSTKYYAAGGLLIGVSVNGAISYLVSDGLGSVSVALSSSGTLVAAQLYGPYGGVRYSSGSMPTARGFTGQYGDATSGLDYYHARYYDPAAGQFTSADTKQGPNRYGYVGGNPETRTDPTGQRCTPDEGCGGGTGGGGAGGGTGTGGNGGSTDGSGGNGGGGGGYQQSTSTMTKVAYRVENTPNSFLQFIGAFIKLGGDFITIGSLGNAFEQQNAANLISDLKAMIANLLKHNRAATDSGWTKLLRGMGDKSLAERVLGSLEKLGDLLTAVGFFADAIGYGIQFYYGDVGDGRPDLVGDARVLAAFGAGLLHGLIMTTMTVSGAAGVEAFAPEVTPLAIGIGAFIGGVGGGFMADAVVPILMDKFVPEGTIAITPMGGPPINIINAPNPVF